MAGHITLAAGVSIASTDLCWRQSLSSGPGGQHAQKTASRVELCVHLYDLKGLPTEALIRLRRVAGPARLAGNDLQLSCDQHRSSVANRAELLRRLTELVTTAMIRPRPRRPTKPSRASVERRLQAKRQEGERKARRRDAGVED